MEIKINGQLADITVEQEKTIADILSGLYTLLDGSGQYINKIAVDGNAVNSSSVDEVLSMEIEKVKVLEVDTVPVAVVTALSLEYLLEDINEFEKTSFEERTKFFNDWKERSYVNFIFGQMPEFYSFFANAFSQGSISLETLRSITEEWRREVKDPAAEGVNIKPILEDVCARLTDLPLDIQTGKDARAAQTIQIFTGIGEKILRIIRQLNIQGYLPETADGEKSFVQITEEFGNVLKELLDAYQRNDTVLVGDLAEYEVTTRLMELYNIIINCHEQAAVQGKEKK